MNKFKIGDRVRNIQEDHGCIPCDLTGTVLDDHNYPYVEWDEKIEDGHNANGLGKYGYCTAQDESYLELIVEESTSDDIKVSVKKMITISILEDEYELTAKEAEYIIKELQKVLGEHNE